MTDDELKALAERVRADAEAIPPRDRSREEDDVLRLAGEVLRRLNGGTDTNGGRQA